MARLLDPLFQPVADRHPAGIRHHASVDGLEQLAQLALGIPLGTAHRLVAGDAPARLRVAVDVVLQFPGARAAGVCRCDYILPAGAALRSAQLSQQ
jgi:hypothetical protein